MSDIEEQVKLALSSVLNLSADSIRLDASLKDDLGATSLDRYTVLMDLEEAFSLDLDDVPEQELEEGIVTVGDIVQFINARISSGDGKGEPS